MSNSRYNALHLNKRPSRLLVDDSQVRKNFGGVAKKPKLDIRLTPVSNTTAVAPRVLVEESFDDMWGEDLSEEAVEECLMLASQVCPEANLGVPSTASAHAEPSSSRDNASRCFTEEEFKIPVQPAKPLTRNSDTKSIISPNQLHSGTNGSLSMSTLLIDFNQQSLGEEIKRLQMENVKLKENDVSQEGEISILRTQLKQMQMQLETQRLDNIKNLDIQGKKYKGMLKEHKKELDLANTQLQFKIMEVTTMKNHCNLLESRSKLKLKDPQPSSISVDSNKRSHDLFPESFHTTITSPDKLQLLIPARLTTTPPRRNHQDDPVQQESSVVPRIDYPIPVATQPKSMVAPREGSVLGQSVNEFLFEKSVPEIAWILYIRRKQSLCRSIKEAEDINSTILTLHQNDKTLENCYTAVNKLIAMDSLSSQVAFPHIEKVVQECQEIVCRQLHILRLLLQVQSKDERVVLNEEIASSIGSLAGKSGSGLLSARQWYTEEEGIESRRALALLSAIADISQLAADLVFGSRNHTSDVFHRQHSETEQPLHNGVNISEDDSKKQKLDACIYKTKSFNQCNPGPSSTVMKTDCPVEERAAECCSWSSGSQSNRRVIQIDYSEYTWKPFGFLCLLRDVTYSISKQRRTKQFIGLLTSMMHTLKTVACRSKLHGNGLQLMGEIIQETVFACPQMEVIIALFELLGAIAPYTEIMSSLCRNSAPTTLVEKRYINLAYFSRESCIIQVLFRLLPNGEIPFRLHIALCSNMVRWLFRIVCVPQLETEWLSSFQDSTATTCTCKQKLTQGLITILCHSVRNFEFTRGKDDSVFYELRYVMGLGVMLLRSLSQRDELFGVYLEKVEGEYDLLLSNIHKLKDTLNMGPMERECLAELSKTEETDSKETFESEDHSDDDYWERNISIFKSLLSKKGPSSHHQPRQTKQPHRISIKVTS